MAQSKIIFYVLQDGCIGIVKTVCGLCNVVLMMLIMGFSKPQRLPRWRGK